MLKDVKKWGDHKYLTNLVDKYLEESSGGFELFKKRVLMFFGSKLAVSVFVKVNQNNYKYWDGYAVIICEN